MLADGAMAVHGTRHREAVTWDYPGLLQLLTSLSRERTGLPLLRCYWYEATVEGRRTPEHDVLADIPGLKLRLARIRPGRREGVDAQTHRDLMTLARNNAICDAVVVSGDEDLAQVVSDAQDLGIRVTVMQIAAESAWAASRTLRQECDDLIEIGAGHLRPYITMITSADPGGPLSGNGQHRHQQAASNGQAHGNSQGHGNGQAHSNSQGHGNGQAPHANGSQGSGRPSGAAHARPSPPTQSSQPALPPAQPSPPAQLPPAPPPGPAQPALPAGSSGPARSSGSAPPSNPTQPSTSAHSSTPVEGSPSGYPGLVSESQSPPSQGLPQRARHQPQSAAPPQAPPSQGASSQHASSQEMSQGTPQGIPSQGVPSQTPMSSPSQQYGGGGSYSPALGPYTGPHPAPVPPQSAATTTLAEAVQAAHKEGHDFGDSVARDAPALWLEAVLARKPRMPSDLEARLLQGSSLPIDFLLHDEVRHALRRGFWDALERARH
ncbi:NYN domain-containing protein [Sphaerimonospora cavernae]|uniref:NYN domain-containing protein n=1 Tax=Sphaerimonospora cavernae TaxID=1740611 RepID=A0ABV6UA90_9ACTN